MAFPPRDNVQDADKASEHQGAGAGQNSSSKLRLHKKLKARKGQSTGQPKAKRGLRKWFSNVQLGGLVVGAIAFLYPLVFGVPGLSVPGERMLAIFLLAVVFWVTEAVPLTATAVLVIFLEVLLISSDAVIDPTGGDPALADAALPASTYFATLANPVIILFLGGFLIAVGAQKYGLDKNIAALILRPFTGSARATVAGLMLITSLLSLFMSNTATTATMFAIVLPVLDAIDVKKVRTGVVLAIPLAANIAGISTPVSTPPNAIAVGALAERGINISFVRWMAMVMPLAIVLLIAAWIFLCVLYIPKGERLDLHIEATWNRSRRAKLFYVIAALTIVLWMTEPFHHIAASTVGFFPVVTLLCMRVMETSEIKKIDWPILWLVSGGIALGLGVGATGLDKWLIGLVDWKSLGALAVLATVCMITLLLSNVMSNSASSNLLIPIALSLTMTLPGSNLVTVAVAVALVASMGFALPISTPPNAIAYSTGECTVKGMATIGITVGTVATLIIIFVMPNIWAALGLV